MPNLRTIVVVDFQNIHLTGHGLFAISKHQPPHLCLVHPLHFANQLLLVRNAAQQPGMDHASLTKVLVYRGNPSPEHDAKAYGRNLAQKSNWERDPRVKVTLRPLTYDYERDEHDSIVTDSDGKRIVRGKREKGVDVLCALALIREAREPDVDLVVLASHDSDLEPALDEALDLRRAKIETCCWFDRMNPHRTRQLRPGGGRRIWNTRLGEIQFQNCWDTASYT
jgi:hypothetical protein